MWGLLVAVWSAYDAAKREMGVLDTEDLQAECVRLLRTSPAVRRRYQRRFRHLLVDEFQDTNPLQMRLITLLHVTARQKHESEPIPPNSLFVVGDVQQSIYGFRNADSALFRDLASAFRTGRYGAYVPLTVNFRSRPEILALVAAIFQQVWRGTAIPFAPLTAGAEFDRKPGPSVEALLTKDLYRRDYIPLEAQCLASRIRTIVESRELHLTSRLDPRCGEPVRYRDVAVLFRSLTDIERYEDAFARAGVPYFVVGGGRGYYARHEVRDLLNVVTVLESPMDDVALSATLRSPFVGSDVETIYRLSLAAGREDTPATSVRQMSHRTPLISGIRRLLESGELPPDEEAKLESFLEIVDRLRAQEDRIPIGRLLERLISHTHYDARLLYRSGGRRRLANVRKLLQIANAEPVIGARGFIQRLKEISVLSDREGDAPTEEEAADVVRFLTIHSAKGLEFPVVVLADLSRNLLRPERGAFICSRRELALGARIDGEPSISYRAIDQRRQEEDKEESERLLYVAMTRAREHLILCANAGRSRAYNWGENLLPLLGLLEPPPEPRIQILAGGVAARIAPMNYALANSE
jgi:ATP-dependent helicase/nuclease subunit A